MTRRARLRPEFVQFVPEAPEDGVLYISRRFATACHLCCCGCGREVVTPLNPAKWDLIEHPDGVSLSPSVGSWNLPCQSHYWIDRNRVHWAASMSPTAIARVRELDRFDAERYRPVPPARPWTIELLGRFWKATVDWIARLWR